MPKKPVPPNANELEGARFWHVAQIAAKLVGSTSDQKRRRADMFAIGVERISDEVILAARILLVMLFVIFGWNKLTDYG